MVRRLFTIPAALSLAFCLAAVGVGLNSYAVERQCLWFRPGSEVWVGVTRGRLEIRGEVLEPAVRNRDILLLGRHRDLGIYLVSRPDRSGAGFPFPITGLRRNKPAPVIEQASWPLGFAWHREVEPAGTCRYQLTAPWWALPPALAVVPAACLRRAFIRARRKRQRRCLDCGYDLRASADRCPECGAPMIPPTH